MEHLWEIEERLWLEGEATFKKVLHEHAVMVFPEPVGILRNEAVMVALRTAPRWRSIEMTARHALSPREDLAVLAYRAAAVREKHDPYHSYCSSTYVLEGDVWWLTHHQHSL